MIKNPDNLIPQNQNLYSPEVKPEVLDHINNLKNKLELLANQVEELKKEKISNDRLKKEIALKQEMEIILKAIFESKEKNQEAEALSEEEKEEREKILRTYISEEKTLDKLHILLQQGANKNSVAEGLSCLNYESSWEMREKLIKYVADKGCVAEGLAGLNCEKTWAMRQDFLQKGAYKGSVAIGLNGDYITAIAWRTKRDRELNNCL